MTFKLGLCVGPNVANDGGFDKMLELANPASMVLMGSYPLANHVPKKCFTIGRNLEYFPDNYRLSGDASECYALGKVEAAFILAFYHKSNIRCWMLLNEYPNKDIEDVRRLASFDAGAVSVFKEAGVAYLAACWSMGTPEPNMVVEYAERFLDRAGSFDGIRWGPHGYTDGVTPSRYLERRPWDMWRPGIHNDPNQPDQIGLDEAGITMPPIFLGECGFDVYGQGGWIGRWNAEQYADYIRRLPTIAPEAIGGAIFGWRMGPGWVTYDISGSEVILRAIGEVNSQGGTQMAWDRHEVYDKWFGFLSKEGYNPATAIGQYRAGHSELGIPVSGELTRDDWPYVIQYFTGGIVYSKKGTWVTNHAANEEALPLA